jgi:hypothetical protein
VREGAREGIISFDSNESKEISFGIVFDTLQNTLLVIDIKIKRYLAL